MFKEMGKEMEIIGSFSLFLRGNIFLWFKVNWIINFCLSGPNNDQLIAGHLLLKSPPRIIPAVPLSIAVIVLPLLLLLQEK